MRAHLRKNTIWKEDLSEISYYKSLCGLKLIPKEHTMIKRKHFDYLIKGKFNGTIKTCGNCLSIHRERKSRQNKYNRIHRKI